MLYLIKDTLNEEGRRMRKPAKSPKAPGRTWKKARPWLVFSLVALFFLATMVTVGISRLNAPSRASGQAPSAARAGRGGAEGGPEGGTAAEAQAEGAAAEGDAAPGGGADREGVGTVESAATGEDFSHDTPTRRYVSETQRHQNFLQAVAEGRVLRMDFMSVDYQPVGDPNSSYITFSLATTDGARSTGSMVMKFEEGMWRISAVKQLGGSLGGGTNYLVPASFEADLKADLENNQPFFAKLAEGRVSALIVEEVVKPSDSETDLYGRVVGRSGRYEETQMHFRKDYSLWHLTTFDYR